ncbi:MAG: 3'(2'),5'-bisphosphate nucleotidase CysQ, partial [Gammaproteobacteria bacterium]|nr:3'(2'),5'-bisphosphate nucleotidase CysQ [Gammaproteobacteria bacterium]
MTDACQHLDAIRALALDVGRLILDVYEQGERDVEVTAKADGSPLTAADRAAHEVIAVGLKRLTPDIPLLSEEFAAVDYETRAHWTRFWLVDPLDGTQEFVSRNGEFTVNIALIEDGRPVLGVVYVPVTGVTYYARRGQGAFKQKGACAVAPVRARRYGGGRPMVVASRSHAGAHLAEFLARLGPHDIVSMGS